MKFTTFAGVFLAVLVLSAVVAGVAVHRKNDSYGVPDVYFGVYAGSLDLNDLKALAEQLKTYTNLFVVGSFNITWNEDKLNEISNDLNDKGLNFMIFEHPNSSMPFARWAENAVGNWGSHFVGLYAYDEPGGYQIDHTEYMAAKEADNYTDAAQKYVANVTDWLRQLRNWTGFNLPMYTSDYALYEYDYRAGYNAVFTQFGWNFSRALQVALCRGAATMHDKPWGAIVTYTFDVSPFLESGSRMYEDLVYAYDNGAKYILVFDYDKNTHRGILQPEHFEAMKQFWQYIKNHPNSSTQGRRSAYVLPRDYGFGFRGPNDKIWGIWEADRLSRTIWNDVNVLTMQYSSMLDVIYEDSLNYKSVNYENLIFWNGTQITG